MKFSLIENAIDSIEHGLEHYLVPRNEALKGAGESGLQYDKSLDKNYKYAILHFVQAVELLYKERLRREHPAFLYSDIDKPNKTKTVSIGRAERRLQHLCGVSLSRDEIGLIRQLVQIRNEIQHG